MAFLGIFLVWLGYVLVYAGIANHGRFATQPWAGVFADAYDSSVGTGGLGDIPGIEGAPQGRKRGTSNGSNASNGYASTPA